MPNNQNGQGNGKPDRPETAQCVKCGKIYRFTGKTDGFCACCQLEEPIPPESGGSGGGCGPFLDRGRADTKLIELAIKRRWPISEDRRESLINRQMDIAEDTSVSPRECTSAFRAVLEADRINLQAEQSQTPPSPASQHVHFHEAENGRQQAEDVQAEALEVLKRVLRPALDSSNGNGHE